jgi:hypothetical protein
MAGGQRAHVTKRAIKAAEGGEGNAALARLVVVVKQVAGHVSDNAAEPSSPHQAVTLNRPP